MASDVVWNSERDLRSVPESNDPYSPAGLDYRILAYLRNNYSPVQSSRPRQIIKLSEAFGYCATRATDGDVGCALLVEISEALHLKLLRKEDIKISILRCLERLKAPIEHASLSPKYKISIRPTGIRPKGSTFINLTSARALRPLPEDVQANINAYAGDEYWWSRESTPALPTPSLSQHSFTIITDSSQIRSFFRSLLPFPCTCLRFGNDSDVFLEWSSDLGRIWVRAVHCDFFIQLVRFLRKLRGEASRAALISVKGHGEALV